MKKKIFMSAALMLLLGGVSANAKAVDGYIVTSCGEVYHFSEVGDKVSKNSDGGLRKSTSIRYIAVKTTIAISCLPA